ncbi:MAG TPA: homoserine kinase [Halanaerobiaceae bacterium]|jgi:homoserine kinase|nr:homoserine kinase [Halanaerobiaceae bacterium]HOA40916.1 homoserine kinase [Halanaerobiales bacterium]HPZ62498.1 homoserine kinase [Halanaerobiales bacterium]HQD03717.1 homoserine kinase [Halanaerobiales bacterium]
MIKIRVPATSANLGPGFDCLGIALNLYNYFIVEEIGVGLETNIIEEFSGRILDLALEDNLFVQAMKKVFDLTGQRIKGIRITEKINIPFARGLGSSASAVVAGLHAANYLTGNTIKEEDLLELAVAMEGHPDNVVPAYKGGFVINVLSSNGLSYKKLELDQELKFIVLIPDFELKTNAGRKALPEILTYSDAVFNISRAALLTASFYDKNYSNLRTAMEDKLHQDYRSRLIPGFYTVLDAAYNAGALGVALSGSGPTLIAIAEENLDEIGSSMVNAFKENDINSRYLVTRVDNDGCTIID